MAKTEDIRTIGIIIIGNEVLSGKVRDENTPFLIDSFNRAGLRVGEVAIVADVVPRLAEVIRSFSERFDLVEGRFEFGDTVFESQFEVEDPFAGAHPRAKFVLVEWFDDIVVGAGVEGLDKVFGAVLRCDQNDVVGSPSFLYQTAEHLAVFAGHHPIQQQ